MNTDMPISAVPAHTDPLHRRGAREGGVGVTQSPNLPLPWPRFWQLVRDELRARGYRTGTLRLYRHVLRSLASRSGRRPDQIGPADIQRHLRFLVAKRASASWTSTTISVIRTVFDKLGGRQLARRLPTPRPAWRLPDTISREEARLIVAAGPTVRDQLLLGLLYGCGLKVGEACVLRWRDITPERGMLTAGDAGLRQRRDIPIPADLLPVLRLGTARCRPDDPVFPGRRPGQALSPRMAEWLVQRAVTASGVGRGVTGMTLRHSYARHCLEQRVSVRELQTLLGHVRIETTLVYTRLFPPADATSPLDRSPTPQSTEVLRLNEPVPVAHLTLPFEPADSAWDRARAFCHGMNLWIRERFMASRAPAPPGPPAP